MSSVFSKYLQVYNAKQWKASISGVGASNVYLTIGKAVPWANDSVPPQANTSVNSYYDYWNNMIGGKKISGNDVRHIVHRFDWTTGTVYNQYDDQIDSKVLKSANNAFYVVTDEWNVYKCISNNYGAYSNSKPTSISTITDVQTEDGYVWKYMYTVSAEEQLRFVTTDYIPVKTLTVNDGSLQWLVQNNAISGGVHNIPVTNGGSGYVADDITVTITGDGQDATAVAVRNTTSHQVESITVTNKGIKYTYANVAITSPTGTGATARVIISPRGGHGSDPLTELGGSNIIINTRIKSSENGVLPVVNEYRQVGLLENPTKYDGSAPATAMAVNQLTYLTLNGTSADYILDETVYQGVSLSTANFSGTVVEWDAANNVIKLSNVQGVPTSELIKGTVSTAARFLSSVTNPDMKYYTGNLLYINNIYPIQRSSDQLEDFKIVLNF